MRPLSPASLNMIERRFTPFLGGAAPQQFGVGGATPQQFGGSKLASDVANYYLMDPKVVKDKLSSDQMFEALQAEKFEKDARAKIAEEDKIYNKTYQDVMLANELAKTKAGAIPAGSYAQRVIAGETGAGQGKEGKFKNIYEAGSMLPASWMQKTFGDAGKAASKLSGVEDINAPVTGQYDLSVIYKNKPSTIPYEFARAKLNKAPLYNTSGLGKYKTVNINKLTTS